MRRGEGATLVEAVLSSEIGDPLDRVRDWLASQSMVDAAAEGALRREVDTEVDAALGTAQR
jgi:TPP-dependent pyruvate/acetoin dehydrogenase alpha subunit